MFDRRNAGRGARLPILALNRPALRYLVGVEFACAAVVCAVVVTGVTTQTTPFERLAGLLALGIVYAELIDRAERFWKWLHVENGAWAAQVGVLLATGVLVLPTWAALVQTVVAYTHAGVRRRHFQTGPAYRDVWSVTTVLFAAMAASALFHALDGHVSQPGLADLAVIAATLVVYSGVNLTVLLSGIWLATRPERFSDLIPARREMGYEAGKLLLGVLGAVLVENAPLLTPAVLVFAALLHRSSLVRELMIDASTDARTGLLTPRAWRRAADAQLAHCRRKELPVALLMLDLDHFKNVNDSHGHAVGDQALAAVGALLQAQLRAEDIVGRHGGEEFVVLLPGATRPAAAEVAERIRGHIAALALPESIRLTASVGMGTDHSAQASVNELFATADSALYEAKAAGRNRVVGAGEPGHGADAPGAADLPRTTDVPKKPDVLQEAHQAHG